MHTDARTLESGTVLEGDLCIVGAGAAGLSMALEWVNSPLKVILLEGGGFDLEPAMQDLYRGDIIGQPYYPLEAARLHYFGGTTGHWAGFCSTYDAIDFEKRSWVPYSGWPIERKDLDPFYARAQGVLELGPYEYDAEYWMKRDPALAPLALRPKVVWTKMWQFSPPTRFGTKYRATIVNARNVHLYTYANVCEVEANDGLTAVRGLRVQTLGGKKYRVRARCYVLACSTIQNARLLLASNRQATTGLGNTHDLVGRYFMEHLEMPGGELVLAKPQSTKMKIYALEFGRTKARGELALSSQVQREHGLLNGTASLTPGALAEDVKSTFQFFTPQLLAAFMEWEKGGRKGPLPMKAPEPPGTLPAALSPPRVFHLMTRQEQAPNPNSRVTLSTEKDALGMPRAKLDWQLTELDKRSIRIFYQLLGQELGRSGTGRVQIRDWLLSDDRTWPSFLSGGWHHMGTTRMHADPTQGVVDSDCRVHGLGNLYVAGAAVYPTAGSANPTLTLVALSLRLSDHLKTTLS
ncbi:MAG: GMC family oxidoreductase [Chloroflexota bacterium]|nr:GMC family oxidoreductase [Chloroflexota bacterium]